MESIRAFFGIQLPAPVDDELAQFIHSLQAHRTNTGIRWSSPPNLHITLQFLQSIDKADIPLLISHVQQQLQAVSRFSIELGQIEWFPSSHKPHVLALQVQPNEALSSLAARVGQGIVQTGYEIEQRPYRAHLTLGRLRDKARGLLPHHSERFSNMGTIAIEDICLWESQPSRQGSCYVLLHQLALGSDG